MLFGLIGKSLVHSFSPRYFSEKFVRERIENAKYSTFELEKIEDFSSLLKEHTELRGLNVTIPYKESIIEHLDEIDEQAKEIGAVNVIHFKEGRTKGYNTDAPGFIKPLEKHLDAVKIAVILGTGGASKAVKFALQKQNVQCILVSRNPKNEDEIDYNQVNQLLHRADLIVNTTPIGTFPRVDEYPSIDYSKIHFPQILYDLVYNPAETVFLQRGKQMGCTIINGLPMLTEQAELSWTIWQKTTL
ncbi:MAG: shikimate dehydrogenase [Flavobacteriales bacterium]|nr:MAG: shikimate dehydrogenase [Flavobacteriales bacterium]